MAGHSRSFTLQDPNQNGVGAPCKETGIDEETGNPLYSGIAGTYTRTAGSLSYYEVNYNISEDV